MPWNAYADIKSVLVHADGVGGGQRAEIKMAKGRGRGEGGGCTARLVMSYGRGDFWTYCIFALRVYMLNYLEHAQCFTLFNFTR